MPTEKKISQVDEIKQKFSEAEAVILADYRGLNVTEMSLLRTTLRESETEVRVYKNTLMKIAATDLGFEDLLPLLEGPNAAFITKDPVNCAKKMNTFAREYTALEIRGGLLENKAITAAQLKALASLPPKEQLIAMLLGTMQAPVASLARVINAPVQSLAIALNRVAEQKAAAA